MLKLDSMGASSVSPLSADDITLLRRHILENQSVLRDTVERLRLSQEESELITRRREELESRLSALEAEYEELLGN